MRRCPGLVLLAALVVLPPGVSPAHARGAAEPPSASEDTADAGYREAIALARAGRTDEALAAFDALLARSPDNPDLLLGRGLTLLWAGRPQEAIAPLERALMLAPDYADARVALDQAYAAAAAPAADRGRRVAFLELRRERLDRGLDPWTGVRAGWERSAPDRRRLAAAAFTERRFGERDDGVAVEGAIPLGAALTLDGSLALAPGAAVIARSEVAVGVHRAWRGGWGGWTRVGQRRFADADVSALTLGLERYAGDWRLAYALGLTDVDGVPGTLRNHALGVDHFRDGGHRIGLRLSSGREDTLVGTDVVAARVRSVVVVGRHPLAGSAWAMGWELGRARQGDFYDRLVLGIRLEYAY